MNVRIVTDSTADIPKEQADALGITVVPLTVFFGDEAYLDGVELDSVGFYRKLAASKELPRTSQPSPAKFQEAYARLIDEGANAIISVHLSGKLSGTYQSACTARDGLLESGRKIPVEQPRTRSKAYARIAQLLAEAGKIEYVSIAEASEEVGQQLAQAIKTTYTGDLPIYRLGAVLGTHTGPGTAAIAYVVAS